MPKERQSGKTKRPCVRCGRFGGHIRSFSLGLCRQCFRENATELGFKQYS
ncbi:MAG: 30S ribosomal protein S14 [Candidatus Woesearchaeota archaeon]|nr:30S ribosomal protein S14 [Candidatus Woesearchaeota archaeon]